ncbi:carbohydrate ABC transporter permease [Paenibacillus oryzisoli]|uniref:Sugar ABC transporter permease n=1 Tax=Paenibacillus oryzisoli TaxID=1850517 RepID=A0A198AR43_9BACL|nr:sugar ABC transporter permease [Paenibacillus oryzisoli]OAS23570.1 sugar ABC transporter permease [Paenibacillus oryzisoli]
MNWKEKTKENVAGYLFILPNLLGFCAFILLPLVFSLILIFTDWNYLKGLQGLTYIGLDNVIKLFHDVMVFKALAHNVIFSAVTVPAAMLGGLLLATILNKHVFLKETLRTLVFLPYMSSLIAIAVVWRVMYNSSEGPINNVLKSLGVSNPPGWLASPDWSLIAIIIMTVWIYVGYAMVLYMAGLQGISKDYYEASEIDGANALKRFWHITLPLLKPTSFMIAITLVIASFQVFASVQVMSNGGPLNSTLVLALYIYRQAFELKQMSYASTVSWLLFIVIFIVTIVQWKGQKKWQDYY